VCFRTPPRRPKIAVRWAICHLSGLLQALFWKCRSVRHSETAVYLPLRKVVLGLQRQLRPTHRSPRSHRPDSRSRTVIRDWMECPRAGRLSRAESPTALRRPTQPRVLFRRVDDPALFGRVHRQCGLARFLGSLYPAVDDHQLQTLDGHVKQLLVGFFREL
jgi:hypothetical protein